MRTRRRRAPASSSAPCRRTRAWWRVFTKHGAMSVEYRPPFFRPTNHSHWKSTASGGRGELCQV